MGSIVEYYTAHGRAIFLSVLWFMVHAQSAMISTHPYLYQSCIIYMAAAMVAS